MTYRSNPQKGVISILDAPLLFTLGLAVLPWIALTAYYRNWETALGLLVQMALITGTGYILLTGFRFLPTSLNLRLSFAPGVGLVFLAASAALAARFAIPITSNLWLFVLPAIVGLTLAGKDIADNQKEIVPAGLALVALSALVALVFYRPHLIVNGVEMPDGRFTWISLDASWNMAISALIKSGLSPTMPGLYETKLGYHYGTHALAGYFSAGTGLELSEAMQIRHGMGLLVLLGTTAGCGHSMARVLNERRLGASFSILGLFFFGELVVHRVLLTEYIPALNFVTKALSVIPSGFGEAEHFFTSHSELWGLVALTLVIGLIISEWPKQIDLNSKLWVLAALSILMVPLNFFGAAGSCGIVCGVAIISHWRNFKSWLVAAATITLMVGFFAILDLFGSDFLPTYVFDTRFPKVGNELIFWLFLDVGLIMYSLRFLYRRRLNTLGIALVLVFLGYSLFYVFLKTTDGFNDDVYAIGFLYCILTMTAMAGISYPFGRVLEGSWSILFRESVTFFKIARGVAILSSFVSLILFALGYLLDIAFTKIHFVIWFSIILFIFLSSGIISLYKKQKGFRVLIHYVFVLLLFLGLIAKAPDFKRFIFGRSHRTLYLSGPEYKTLQELKMVTTADDLIATNKHNIAESPEDGASYQYIPISERRFLLEGFHFGGNLSPIFKTIKKDNELLFTTSDSSCARRIVDQYGIDYIICRPETNLKISAPYPQWLNVMDNMEALTVYKVKR